MSIAKPALYDSTATTLLGSIELPPVIHVVEDDPAVRESFKWMLRHVGAEIKLYALPSEVLDVPPSTGPSCLLVDLRLPEMDGLSLLSKLRERGWNMPFIVVSGNGDVPVVVSAMRLGAIDFLQKPIAEAVICRLVDEAIQRDRERIAGLRQREAIKNRLAQLTKRELDVLEGVVAGKLNKQIATQLGVVVKTIETHRANLTRKLEVGSVAELVKMVVEHRQSEEKFGQVQGKY